MKRLKHFWKIFSFCKDICKNKKNMFTHSLWLPWHFWKTSKASHKCYINNQVKKVLGCVYNPKSNNLKIWKCPHLKAKFACLYSRRLRGHSIFQLCDFISSYGTQDESFKGTVSQDFWQFFVWLKYSTWIPYERFNHRIIKKTEWKTV